MRRPRIGIPLCLDDRGRWRAGRSYLYIDRSYAEAVDRAGGSPIQLPIQQDPASVVDGLDGLLLPGGDDFPSPEPLPTDVALDLVSPEQLAFDEALFTGASERGLPVLGICYGMQLMARARGGELEAHLPSLRPDAQEHRLPAAARHPVEIRSKSLLATILGGGRQPVNSLHHQGVRSVGPEHRAVAFSPDGLIEAIEVPSPRASAEGDQGFGAWEIGVQWHPEKMPEDSSGQLFGAFVDACRRRQASR